MDQNIKIPNILAIIGSASAHSSNQKLVEYIASQTKGGLNFTVLQDLKRLPHFDPELSVSNPPESVTKLRNQIESADAILICTPEYVFSIPSGLKNALEWCVATTVFSGKAVGIITASADGEKGHEELQLILETLMVRLDKGTTLLIKGIKGKMDPQGQIIDAKTQTELLNFIEAFKALASAG